MKIYFFVRFSTRYGQQLAVTGNMDVLGNNEVSKAFPLKWYNHEFWYGEINIEPARLQNQVLQYKYILRNENGLTIQEWGNDRLLPVAQLPHHSLQVIDTWNHAGEVENAFFTDPFQQYLLPQHETVVARKQKISAEITHVFKVKAPLLKAGETVCIIGDKPVLGNWSTVEPLLLQKEDDWYTISTSLHPGDVPLQYKYGIYNTKENRFVTFEEGDNRLLEPQQQQDLTVLHDGFVHMPNNTFKGTGVAIPVFSLRTSESFGVGEFADIRKLVDWCTVTGLKMIQLLPVNDTSATNTWKDTYPYAAISAFALHPLYIDVRAVAGKKYAAVIEKYARKQAELNSSADVQYEAVMQFKWDILHQLYDAQKKNLFSKKGYQQFFDENAHWLVPYAAFCYLRDQNGTPDFGQWKKHQEYDEKAIQRLTAPQSKHYDKIAIHYFVQYHLHIQLSEAVQYAHEQGVIIKGDIPIGIYRYGVDAWVDPSLYHMNMQAGAPPDDFAVKGQNWGFPTYNWEKMAENNYDWWKKRFHQMSYYFDAFRIDHILGFFRIWSIPDHAVEGILGYFVHALPIEAAELEGKLGWFDRTRLSKPYINDTVLWEMFGPNQYKFLSFLQKNDNDTYQLLDAFATQRAVKQYFAELPADEENENLQRGLFDLIANVILLEEEQSNTVRFHFRFGMHHTASYKHLSHEAQKVLDDLYVDYFFRRQDEFWKKAAMNKLPYLKAATNMLICGEDLGMVPACVPDVMQQLGILSLEIQRMPKQQGTEFFHPKDAPYLSVVTPSTHDMSTVRGWWEEDMAKTQRFYHQILQQQGTAPFYCEPWINEMIIDQHLYSPAMWAVFQLQDLLGMDGQLRRELPAEERINIPAITNYHWKYRMHITLETLISSNSFNERLRHKIQDSDRLHA